MKRTERAKRLQKSLILAAVLAGLALMLSAGTGWTDDTLLFKTSGGKPYVFIFFDTSSSMTLGTGGPVPASGDDPQSIFYQAKQAVFEVFHKATQENGDIIHFGFAGYQQDRLRVRGKHWLYQVTGGSPVAIGNQSYPAVGDTLTFGKHFPTTASPGASLPIPVAGQLGACATPIALSAANRTAINRFPKLEPVDDLSDGLKDGEIDAVLPTTIWLTVQNQTYRMVVKQQGVAPGLLLGQPEIDVTFEVTRENPAQNCNAPTAVGTTTMRLKLVTEFLFHEEATTNNQGTYGAKSNERAGGAWNYQDAAAVATCGDNSHPFSGTGWEGNYDSGLFVGSPASFPTTDPFVSGATSYNLRFPTRLHPSNASPNTQPEFRTLDRGDMLPYHWEDTHRVDFFRRLTPSWDPGEGTEDADYRAAPFFKDVPNAEGFLELRNTSRRPLVAYGASPIGKSLVDWRCFYLGNDGSGNKCRNDEQVYGRGFDWLAADQDLQWGCRRPYLIVIGDGEDNCPGENPAADTANLKRQFVQAWVFNFGGPDSGDLRRLATNTGGAYIPVTNKQQLADELTKIIGEIIKDTRTFASAAVPTVQAEDSDKIFLSSFFPVENISIWPGTVNAFLKPVPLNVDGTPNTSAAARCSSDPTSPTGRSGCFLWSAGESMLGQVKATMATQLGTAADQRRVYYAPVSEPGRWAAGRRFFDLTSTATDNAVRYDLWRAMGIIPGDAATGSLTAQEPARQTTANTVVTKTYQKKFFDPNSVTTPQTTDDLPYILGDIFHSTPVIVGAPANNAYFAANLGTEGESCDDGDPGYRCFLEKHLHRRKMLLQGSNDGMLHAIDAGIFRDRADPAEDGYDDGTGKEIFGYVPRPVMRSLKGFFVDGLRRGWTVDGNVTVADTFIDPLQDGVTFPEDDDRQWRTVAIGTFREGGTGYYAVDITQPDTYDDEGRPQPVNGYVPSCANGGSDCGPLPFPAPLWEFTDGVYVESVVGNSAAKAPRMLPLDEDFNGLPDLATSWSTPNIGRIRICAGSAVECAAGTKLEDRYVAVLGGGLSHENQAGDWLYMVDIETGLAIYKRKLLDTNGLSSGGAAPAEPAAVDTDGDGYLDRIYIGTMLGYMYRVDLRGPAGEYPELGTVSVTPTDNGVPQPDFRQEVQRITGAAFRPRIIFKAQADALTTPLIPWPIYYRPSVIYVGRLGKYALAFGVGERDNLWTRTAERSRFYVLRDDIEVADKTTFFTEDDLEPIDSSLSSTTINDYLTDSTRTTRGWFMVLDEDERLITNPFAISGVLLFTVFKPDRPKGDAGPGALCPRTGNSRIFGVLATNGNGLLYEEDGTRIRSFSIKDFVTDPYVEQSGTKNRGSTPGAGGSTADDLEQYHVKIMDELKKLFPKTCKFANHRLDVKTLSSDTGIHLIAPVPVCIIDKNWKEF